MIREHSTRLSTGPDFITKTIPDLLLKLLLWMGMTWNSVSWISWQIVFMSCLSIPTFEAIWSMIGSNPISLFLDESISVEREIKWAANQHTHTKKSDILRPRKYLCADDSTFAAVSAARTGNILLNLLMTTALMWQAWIAHSACCDSESRCCNPGSLQNALTSELIKGHQKYEGPAGHMVNKWLSKTMERNTGDKGLALEDLLLFYIQCVHIYIRLIYLYSGRWLLQHSQGREEVLQPSIMACKRRALEFSELRTYNLPHPFMNICVEAWDSRFFTKFKTCLLSAAYNLLQLLWRTWWKQCIILSCRSNSYSRYMLGQGYQISCVSDFNDAINW